MASTAPAYIEAPAQSLDGASLGGVLAHAEIASIMTKSVICVTPAWTLRELMVLLVDGDMGGVPVVDEAWRAIGIVSKSDIVRYVLEHGTFEGATVADCMLPLAMTVTPATAIQRVAALMAWEGIHRLPVCGPAGDVIGIVSTLDIARWAAKLTGDTQDVRVTK
jgi:CBS-domain-containing membrane protein